MKNDMTFGEMIKSVRTQLLLTQREFAKEFGVTYATVARWETEKVKPLMSHQRQLREYCQKKGLDSPL